MRSLFVLELVLGVGAMGAGVAGVSLWSQAYSAYIPGLWCGLMFLVCGWCGLQSTGKMSSRDDILTSVTLHMVSLPFAACLLSQTACNVGAYMPQGTLHFNGSSLTTRGTAVSVMLVDVGLMTSAVLHIFLALTLISGMKRRLKRHQHQPRSFYANPPGLSPPMRHPVTHAWSYTPTLMEPDLATIERDRHYLNAYSAVGSGPAGYQLPHLTASISNRENRANK